MYFVAVLSSSACTTGCSGSAVGNEMFQESTKLPTKLTDILQPASACCWNGAVQYAYERNWKESGVCPWTWPDFWRIFRHVSRRWHLLSSFGAIQQMQAVPQGRRVWPIAVRNTPAGRASCQLTREYLQGISVCAHRFSGDLFVYSWVRAACAVTCSPYVRVEHVMFWGLPRGLN